MSQNVGFIVADKELDSYEMTGLMKAVLSRLLSEVLQRRQVVTKNF